MSDSCKTRVLGRWSFMIIYSCHRKLSLSFLFVPEFILLGFAACYCKCGKSLTIKSRGQKNAQEGIRSIVSCLCTHAYQVNM